MQFLLIFWQCTLKSMKRRISSPGDSVEELVREATLLEQCYITGVSLYVYCMMVPIFRDTFVELLDDVSVMSSMYFLHFNRIFSIIHLMIVIHETQICERIVIYSNICYYVLYIYIYITLNSRGKWYSREKTCIYICIYM